MAFLDNVGLERLWLHITAKLNTKVDTIDGKGLSTEDYTTEEKNKLSAVTADELSYLSGVSSNVQVQLDDLQVVSWDDLEGKPFGEEVKETVIFPETELTFYEVSENSIPESGEVETIIQSRPDIPVYLEVGKTYRVSFDGVTYDAVCGVFNEGDSVYIGNPAYWGAGENNNLPFHITCYFEYGEAIFAVYEGLTHTVGITYVEETITPINEKYLPAPTIWYFAQSSNVLCSDEDLTVEVTYEEACAVNPANLWLKIAYYATLFRPVAFEANSGRVIVTFIQSDGDLYELSVRNPNAGPS